MIKLQTLASGSKANAILAEVNGVKILLDCGLNHKELCKRLAMANTVPGQIHSIYISHGHSDHQNNTCLAKMQFLHKTRWPVCFDSPNNFFPLPNGGFIKQIPAIHDVHTVNMIISDGTKQIAYVTDTGNIPEESLPYLLELSGIILEVNHSFKMLIGGNDPDDLKLRISETHLNNQQAHDLLRIIKWDGLKFVVGHHQSSRNNSPRLAEYALSSAVGDSDGVKVVVAEQDNVGEMMVVF